MTAEDRALYTVRKEVKKQCPCCGCSPWDGCNPELCPVCGKSYPNPSPLDVLVEACTACGTWAQMVQAMQGGYCPTIYQDTRRKRLLTKVIRAAGFRVYIGGGFAK